MKTIILFFIFYHSFLYADCSKQNFELSSKLYEKVKKERSQLKQITLLKKAQELCNSPELRMSICRIKAELANSIEEKKFYYKEAIGTLDDFKDTNERRVYLKQFNLKLTELYELTDKDVSNIYRKKVNENVVSTQENNESFNYIFFSFVILLLLYTLHTLYTFLKQIIQRKRGN